MRVILKYGILSAKAKPRIPSSNIKSISVPLLPTLCAHDNDGQVTNTAVPKYFKKNYDVYHRPSYAYTDEVISYLYLVLLFWNLFQRDIVFRERYLSTCCRTVASLIVPGGPEFNFPQISINFSYFSSIF